MMMHGCTDPPSTFHPYALAIAPHNITDPIGANANAAITKRASKDHIHGNHFWRGKGGGFIDLAPL